MMVAVDMKGPPAMVNTIQLAAIQRDGYWYPSIRTTTLYYWCNSCHTIWHDDDLIEVLDRAYGEYLHYCPMCVGSFEWSPTFLYELDDLVTDFNGDKYYVIGRVAAEDFCGGKPVYELEMMNARNTESWVFPEDRIAEKVDISKFE